MADSKALPPPTEMVEDNNEKRLKYLDFVQMAAIYIVVCFTSIYEYAKETSGPLKPGVQKVEDAVKTVIGPVYEKFHDVPFEFLKFIDRKVDESLREFGDHVPPLVKQASNQAITLAQKAPEAARAVASEVHNAGVVSTAANITKTVYSTYEPMAKELYSKYEPVAEQYAVWAWHSLNRLPLFPQAAQIVVPTAAYWSERYNQTVQSTEGYPVAAYLPLIPVDRIRKVFEEGESDQAFSSDGECVTVQQ